MIEQQKGISSLLENYDGFIVDLWGVVYDRKGTFSHIPPLLERMKDLKKKVFFLSNSSHRKEVLYKSLHDKFAIPRDLYLDLFSSGESMYDSFHNGHFMERYRIQNRCFVIDTIPNEGLLSQLNVIRVKNLEDADFILALDILENEEKIHKYDAMMKAARQMDIPMVCGNIDRIIVDHEEVLYKPGELAFRYQKMGGRLLHAYGKPNPYMFKRAIRELSCDHSRILMVGDGLITDIVGANSMDLDSALVTSGIHSHEITHNFNLSDLFKKYHTHPTFCIDKFSL